jgi:hypothetical protein
MKRLILIALSLALLAGCETNREYVYVPAEQPGQMVVTLELRECDGKLFVDFAGLEQGTLTLRASDATTRKTAPGEWVAVVTFGGDE